MQIYIAEGTQQTGPFDLDTIKSGLSTGKYQPSQLAWYEGAPGWEPIGKLPGMEAVAAPPPVAPAIPPPYSPAPPSYSPAPGSYSPAPGSYSPAPPAYSPTPAAPPTGAYSPPPPSFVPPASYPPSSYPPAGAAPKKGFWATVGGVLLALLAIVVGIIKVASPFLRHSSSGSSSSSSYSSTPASAPAIKKASYSNAAGLFTSGERQKYYVNFRFDYPASWEILSGTKTENDSDFVELKRTHNDIYVETFSVEDFYTTGTSLAVDLPKVGSSFIKEVEASRRKKAVGNFQHVSEGSTKFHGNAAYEYRAQWTAKNDAGQPFTLYLRYLIVAPPTGKNGVILEMNASSSSPDVKGINDLGTKGEMTTILDSFAFR